MAGIACVHAHAQCGVRAGGVVGVEGFEQDFFFGQRAVELRLGAAQIGQRGFVINAFYGVGHFQAAFLNQFLL